MKTVRYIQDVEYRTHMRIGGDGWRPYGNTDVEQEFRPVFTGTPISFDKDNEIFETTNTIYHVESYGCDPERFWAEVKKDVEFFKEKTNA